MNTDKNRTVGRVFPWALIDQKMRRTLKGAPYLPPQCKIALFYLLMSDFASGG
jgi:hypothetical protein